MNLRRRRNEYRVGFRQTLIFGKTESGRRFIPLSSRVKQIPAAGCMVRSEGWVWISRLKGKHFGERMVYRQWAWARQAAGLPCELALYCARRDFGKINRNALNARHISRFVGIKVTFCELSRD